MALTFSATTLRNDGFIGLSRLLQALFAIVVLALVGSGFPSWQNNGIGCSIPSSMNYMVACGVLTLLFVVYLAVSTCFSRANFLWNPYVQLGLDGLFVIFWIAACAVATPTCAQFEDACSPWMSYCPHRITWSNLEIYFNGFDCTCDGNYISSSYKAKRGGLTSSTANEMKGGLKLVDKVAEKQGVGAALVLLFAFTLAFGLYRFFQDKRAAQASATSGQSEPLSSENENKGPQETVEEVSP